MSFPPLLSCVTMHIQCAWPQMTVSCNNNTMASTPAAAVPFVITFGYDNFTQDPSKRITKSNVCGIKKDAGSTTSNFIRQLKTQLIDESLGNVKNVTAYGLVATLSIFRKK